MNSRFFIVTIGARFLFMVLAIINAGIQNGVHKPVVDDLAAHQISSICAHAEFEERKNKVLFKENKS